METHRIHSLCYGAFTRSWKPANFPHNWSKDCRIARRCKLFVGTELERGAIVLEDPFVWPWNAAENSQRQACRQSLTLSESTTRDGLCSASDTPQAALRPTY